MSVRPGASGQKEDHYGANGEKGTALATAAVGLLAIGTRIYSHPVVQQECQLALRWRQLLALSPPARCVTGILWLEQC